MRVIFGASGRDRSGHEGSVKPPDTVADRAGSMSAQRVQAMLGFSDELLARHRAGVLTPQTAVRIAGQPRPLPTAYRLDVLLVPEDLWTPDELGAMNAVLAPTGVYLAVPCHGNGSTLPRPVRIRVLPGAAPVLVDAWTVLQTLRAAASGGGSGLDRATVARLALDHLMCGATSGISLFGENMPTEGSGVDGVTSYGRIGYGGRTPVVLALHPPARRRVAEGTRRPVVAVLDSGIGPHPWFTPDVLSVRTSVQDAVIETSKASADDDGPAITTSTDGPAVDDPLVGTLASHYGHGTFIAGVVRQVGPDADIQVVRVMHSDGIGYESDVLCALATLADEVVACRAGDRSVSPVDVVSLSLGYFDEGPDPATATIAGVLGELTALGVTVVAAAGNFATTRPFLPAALARGFDGDPKRAPMLSVGALNPNGTIALFSDEGSWVTCFASGVSLVSTYPVSAQGSETAENSVPPLHRESLDTDDFTGGFAMWSGSSFATPVVVGRLAQALARAGLPGPGCTGDAVHHARAALDAVAADADGWAAGG